ncbi:MAG: hypothetical protein ACTHK1_06280 [Actinomycetales bacterium]
MPTHLDLSVPIWTIEHVAAALFVSVDTAHHHTYAADFPGAAEGFARNLWLREEVLARFATRRQEPFVYLKPA